MDYNVIIYIYIFFFLHEEETLIKTWDTTDCKTYLDLRDIKKC